MEHRFRANQPIVRLKRQRKKKGTLMSKGVKISALFFEDVEAELVGLI